MLFLISLAITTILTALQLSGHQVLDLIIIMIIIDFLSFGASLELEKRKNDKESKGLITTRLDGIENICKDIFTHVTSPNPGLEAKLEKQKDDMSYILDKIAKKSLELEEKLNAFGQVLTNKVKVEDKTEEETKEETPAETFNVGELVYMEEEEKEN